MKSLVKGFAVSILLIYLNNCTAQNVSESPRNWGIDYKLTAEEKVFLDTLQHRTFLYFWDESNPANGLVKDRTREGAPASIAAVGFALPAWAIGVERGWITRDQATERTLAALRFFLSSEQSVDSLVTGHQGFYYHFLDMQTGKRVWGCELSTIDTAWLLAGVRFAAQYFYRRSAEEEEIRTLADSMTFRVNWGWTTLPSSSRHPGAVAMGWRPEKGFTRHGWVGLNEGLYIYILAAGSGYPDAKAAYQEWLRHYRWEEPYRGLAHVIFPPLFGHQYSQMFVDFRGLVDDYMAGRGLDYFENSRRATLTQRQYAIDNPMGWVGYDSLTWGLTACDGPGPEYNFDDKRFARYSARGSSGPEFIEADDGTIAPTAAGGSIVFAPEIVIPTLQAMYDRYGRQGLWGRHGFVDAFNPTVKWFDTDYLGIDQGPILIMIENLRSGLVWKYCMRDPVIRKGLEVLGFRTRNNESPQ